MNGALPSRVDQGPLLIKKFCSRARPRAEVSLLKSKSTDSFPLQTCRKNKASISFAAWISLASVERSDSGKRERSAPISVGAKRAAIRWRSACEAPREVAPRAASHFQFIPLY
jgi:hypothetical protein